MYWRHIEKTGPDDEGTVLITATYRRASASPGPEWQMADDVEFKDGFWYFGSKSATE